MIAALAAVALLVAGGVVYLLTRGSGTPAVTAPTAKTTRLTGPTTASQWLSAAFAAANAKGTVHVDVLTKLRGKTSEFSDDDGNGVGIQRITISGGGRAEVRVLPGVTYFAANREALTGYFGFPSSLANRAAGRWMVLHPGAPGYTAVTEGVTLSSMMNEISVRGPLKLLPARTVQGVRVVGIRGIAGSPELKRQPKTPATLWVTASGSHLPVVYTAANRKLGSMTTMFSQWGSAVSVSAPTAG